MELHKFSDIQLSDPFFDSLKNDYPGFSDWYAKKAARDTEARNAYFSLERNRYQKGDLYITQILEEEMKADDPRL